MSSNDPDPDRLICDYTDIFAVPHWDKVALNNSCTQCKQKFSFGHKHNCRLCGLLFCSSCTGKFHIPQKFELKNKCGPSRVCHRCRDQCLQRRAGGANAPKDPSLVYDMLAGQQPGGTGQRRNSMSRSSVTGNVMIHPPDWVALTSQKSCFKCRAEFASKKKHHCRACGRLFCGTCSSKMVMPKAFLKKDKPGPQRVCDLCRYLILSGAELCEDPIALPPPASELPEIEAEERFLLPEKDTVTLTVKWEAVGDEKAAVLTHVECRNESETLGAIYKLLLQARPELEEEKFSLLCRGKEVPREHWDIFTLNHIGSTLYLRPEESAVTKNGPVSKDHLPMPLHQQIVKHTRNMSHMRQSFDFEAANHHKQGVAMYPYSKAGDAKHLTFAKGETIFVSRRDNDLWWYGETANSKGWFPAAYVKLLPTPSDLVSSEAGQGQGGGDNDETIPPPPPSPNNNTKRGSLSIVGSVADTSLSVATEESDSDDESTMRRRMSIDSPAGRRASVVSAMSNASPH